MLPLHSIALAAFGGAVGGALAATGIGAKRQVIGNALISGATELVSQVSSGNKDVKSIAANVVIMTGVGAVSGKIGGEGIRAKGTEYRKSLDHLKSLQGNVDEVLKSPKNYRHKLYKAIKRKEKAITKAWKSTTKSFSKAAGFATTLGHTKNWVRRRRSRKRK